MTDRQKTQDALMLALEKKEFYTKEVERLIELLEKGSGENV